MGELWSLFLTLSDGASKHDDSHLAVIIANCFHFAIQEYSGNRISDVLIVKFINILLLSIKNTFTVDCYSSGSSICTWIMFDTGFSVRYWAVNCFYLAFIISAKD